MIAWRFTSARAASASMAATMAGSMSRLTRLDARFGLVARLKSK